MQLRERNIDNKDFNIEIKGKLKTELDHIFGLFSKNFLREVAQHFLKAFWHLKLLVNGRFRANEV